MSAFDSYQRTVFDTVMAQFGDVATWTPSAGGDAISAQVGFADPTELISQWARKAEHKKDAPEWDVSATIIEFYSDDFPGLRSAVEAKSKEIITINGIRYLAKNIRAKWDGKTVYATIARLA